MLISVNRYIPSSRSNVKHFVVDVQH